MPESPQFDEIFDKLVIEHSKEYRESIGPAVSMTDPELEQWIGTLRESHNRSSGMSYWQILNLKRMSITANAGDEQTFGRKILSFRDFLRQMHPDYLQLYLQWRAAAYAVLYRHEIELTPLGISYRFSVPFLARDKQYYWFSIHSTVVQMDAERRIVSFVNTLYLEGRYSPHNLRPFEAMVLRDDLNGHEREDLIIAHLTPFIIDELTNAELDLLTLYAEGLSVNEVCIRKGWSKHTLHEYNANLLKKARRLFQFDFRNAREFAKYLLDKQFIHIRKSPN